MLGKTPKPTPARLGPPFLPSHWARPATAAVPSSVPRPAQVMFEEVRSVATTVMDGFSCCVMAYGATGSGKTHTMM
eukprot:1347316-Prymnesium_polylepis.1